MSKRHFLCVPFSTLFFTMKASREKFVKYLSCYFQGRFFQWRNPIYIKFPFFIIFLQNNTKKRKIFSLIFFSFYILNLLSLCFPTLKHTNRVFDCCAFELCAWFFFLLVYICKITCKAIINSCNFRTIQIS